MEAAVMNLFCSKDKVLVVNGGSFGKRFVQICEIHNIPFSEIKITQGKDISEADLKPFDNSGYTGLLINVCETSTGVHYNIDLVSGFCKRNGIFLCIDAISSFLADSLDMNALHAGAVITGSQKALATPPVYQLSHYLILLLSVYTAISLIPFILTLNWHWRMEREARLHLLQLLGFSDRLIPGLRK